MKSKLKKKTEKTKMYISVIRFVKNFTMDVINETIISLNFFSPICYFCINFQNNIPFLY